MQLTLKHAIKFLLCTLTGCLFSCTKTVEVVLPVENKLVVHGYVQVGDHFSVTVSRVARTAAIPADSNILRNAWVVLYENDVFVDSLKYDVPTKKYVSQRVIAELGKTYTLKAGVNGYPSVEARATAPRPVPTVSVSHIPNARYNDIGDYLDDVQFSLQDPADAPNYYLVEIHPSKLSYITVFCVNTNDPAVEQPRGEVLPFGASQCLDPDEILFTDKSFNGTVKTITLSTVPVALKTLIDSSGRSHRPYLKRYHMSQEFYEYFKQNSSQNNGEDPIYLAEPTIVKGNIINGYGMFAIFTVAVDTLRL